MKYWTLLIVLLWGCESSTPTSPASNKPADLGPVTMHGYLKSRSSHLVRPPSGRDWSYKILMLAPEGERVKKGDLVARFEGEESQKRLRETESQALQSDVDMDSKITSAKNSIDALIEEIGDGEKDLDLLKTGADEDSLTGDWLLSGRDRLIAKLDIQSKELSLRLSRQKLARKRKLLTSIQESAVREKEKFAQRIEKFQASIAAGDVSAPADGVVVYKLNWRREKPRVGGMAYRGADVMEIVDDRNLYVEAYLRETDWPFIKTGQKVQVKILGRRETVASGKITRMSKIVMKVSDWERSLPEGHILYEQQAFRLLIELENVPQSAKPNGEVLIEAPRGAPDA